MGCIGAIEVGCYYKMLTYVKETSGRGTEVRLAVATQALGQWWTVGLVKLKSEKG